MRVAALADVHGNAPALAAVLEEVARERPGLVVFCGDLTWGSLPQETLTLVRALDIPARFVRGNADRAVGTELDSRGSSIDSMHTPEDRAFLSGFEATVLVEIDGLGPTRLRHGSPRSDEECITDRTPAERVQRVHGRRRCERRRQRARPRELRPRGRRHSNDRAGKRRASGRVPRWARGGRSSVPTSSSGAPTTTSRRLWRTCARRTIRASRRSSSSCLTRPRETT